MEKEELEFNKESIKETITDMFDFFVNEGGEDNPLLQEEVSKTIKNNGLEGVFYSFLYPLGKAVKFALMKRLGIKEYTREIGELEFILMNYNYVENNFKDFIIKEEGTAFSSDKSGYLMKMLYNYFATGKQDFEFKDEEGKKHYWHTGVFCENNGDEWIELYNALHSLYYGNKLPYLEFLKTRFIPFSLSMQKAKENEKREKEKTI